MRSNIGDYAYLRLPPGAVSDDTLWNALLDSGATKLVNGKVQFNHRNVDDLLDTANEELDARNAWDKSQIHGINHLEHDGYVLSARRIGKAGWIVEFWATLSDLEKPRGPYAPLRKGMDAQNKKVPQAA